MLGNTNMTVVSTGVDVLVRNTTRDLAVAEAALAAKRALMEAATGAEQDVLRNALKNLEQDVIAKQAAKQAAEDLAKLLREKLTDSAYLTKQLSELNSSNLDLAARNSLKNVLPDINKSGGDALTRRARLINIAKDLIPPISIDESLAKRLIPDELSDTALGYCKRNVTKCTLIAGGAAALGYYMMKNKESDPVKAAEKLIRSSGETAGGAVLGGVEGFFKPFADFFKDNMTIMIIVSVLCCLCMFFLLFVLPNMGKSNSN